MEHQNDLPNTDPNIKSRQNSEGFNLQSIDVIAFFKNNLLRIIITSIIFGIIGAVYSLLLPKEYSSTMQILPELQSKSGLGGFRALADLAGINVDNIQVSEAIRPDLYPSVLESTPFLIAVSQLEIQALDNVNSETIENFLSRQSSPIGNVNKMLTGWIPGRSASKDFEGKIPASKIPSSILILTKKQENTIKRLSSLIKASLDKKTGIIAITVTMPDPVVAAWTAEYSSNYLTDYMLGYRSAKQAQQVEFFKKQIKQAESRFKSADQNLRNYRDRNRNPFLTGATSDESKFQSELSIAQNLFLELSRQYEQANIKMKEETPVLKVLEPAQVPLLRSSPKRAKISLYFLIFGAFVQTFWCLFRYNSKK